MTSKKLRLAIAAMALMMAPKAALANGRYPAASQLVVAPLAPKTLLLRTTYGILLSKDAGQTWDWICERAVGFGGVEDPSMGILGAHTLLAGTFEGLAVSPDDGCGWAFAGGALDKQGIIDVVVRRDAPAQGFALTSTYDGEGDAGSTYKNDLFATTDEGAHWTQLGSLPDEVLSETVEVAPSDPARLYASSSTGLPTAKKGQFYVSTDGGTTFAEFPVELTSDERAPFISAVDPQNADRVYVRTSSDDHGRLLVTDDAGKTFRQVFEGPPLLGFALSADGAKVWVGSTDGLFMAPSDTLAFTKQSSVQIQCLALSGSTLYACSNESSGFIVGSSTDEGKTFTPLLHLWTLRGPLSCAPGTSAAVCAEDWPPIRDLLGIAADGGSEAPPAPTTPKADDGGGCSASAWSVDAWEALAGACFVVCAIAWRRRRVDGR